MKLWQELKKISWDNSVSMKQKVKWIKIFAEIFQMQKIIFQRRLRTKNTIGRLLLVVFSDGSKEAFRSCAYLRCELESSSFSNKLIMLKNQVTSIRKMTQISSKLCGAVLSARILRFITNECSLHSERTFFIVTDCI